MQLLKRLLRYGKSTIFLNRTRQQAHSAFELTNSIQHSIRDLFDLLYKLNDELSNTKDRMAALERNLDAHGGSLAAQSNALAAQAELALGGRRSYEQKLSAVCAAVDMLSRSALSH